MKKSLRRLATAVAGAALTVTVGVAVAADPPPSGPAFPPPGGVTLTGDGDTGRPGGRTWTYADLELHRFDPLMWGVHSHSLPALSMDGATDDPGETMTFSAGESDLAAGRLVFAGQAELPGHGTFPTRAIIATTTAGGAPLPMTPAAGAELPAQIGGVAVIGGDFKANLRLEVAGVPAKDFFDSAQTTPQQADDLHTSIGGAFYWVPANELPEASFDWAPASPKALQTVTFTSTSTDPDGAIAATAWDLDGDGEFDDAEGDSASTTFAEAGEYTVGVRVIDDRGGVGATTQVVTVTSCERGPVSQTLRQAGGLAGLEPTIRQVNCDVLEPLGL